MKKTLLAGTAIAALSLPALALAQATPAAPTSPHTFTANVGLFSQYIFRGLTQTNRDPAIQGGFDYAYDTGAGPSLYLGTWNSNISWLHDGGQYTSSSLESDWYAGIRGPIGKSDFTYDVGFLYYWYPGNVVPGVGEKGDTQEIYGALGWKWLTAKLSYSISNKTFAVRDSSGTYYLDITANYPVADSGVNLIAHWGRQKYSGTDPRNIFNGRLLSNDEVYSYDDLKLGLTYDLSKASTPARTAATSGMAASPRAACIREIFRMGRLPFFCKRLSNLEGAGRASAAAHSKGMLI